MAKIVNISFSGLALTALLSAAGTLTGVQSAGAVVYCKSVGVPKGCVATRPYVPAARVATPYVGTPYVGAPGVGAPGVGVRAGTPMNRGGPVNRVGVR